METRAVILSLLFSAVLCASGDEGFARYKFILDKHPFGRKPLAEELVTVPASGSFAATLRLSMLFQGADGLPWAGVVDQAGGKNYILKLEDPQNGLELISADMEAAEAMIRKGSEVVLFKLEPGSPRPGFKSPAQIVQEARLCELSKPIQVQAPEPGASGEAFRKYLESGQMDAALHGPVQSVQETE